MEPESTPMEKETHLQSTIFWGSMLVFGGVCEVCFLPNLKTKCIHWVLKTLESTESVIAFWVHGGTTSF